MKKNSLKFLLFAALLGYAFSLYATDKTDKKAIKRIRKDITYLASDELEGRRTSQKGEALAADFIESRYKELGIAPYNGKYRYPFHFVYGKEIATSNKIVINGTVLNSKEDAFPLPFSASKAAKGSVSHDINASGVVVVLPLFKDSDEASSPHFEWEKVVSEKAKAAEKNGATAIIIYDNYGAKYEPSFNGHSDFDPIGIPVVYVNQNTAKKVNLSTDGTQIDLNININKSERSGINIAAFIDNKAPYTVILGAHFDHLGYGEDGNSLFANAIREHQIHHGADDNASGTAAVLEEARRIKENKQLHNFNYLFLDFSAEELGLYGSKDFVKTNNIDSDKFAYMINLDMVGRLNDSTHALSVGGIGTSPSWDFVQKLAGGDFKLIIDSSGVGPSDHSSFNNAGIPVLFFYTGSHKDYHKPSDIAKSINYEGEVGVLSYLDKVIAKMDADNKKPKFISTKMSSLGQVKFKVTLGIMPDYAYQDGGVRIDGVTDGRPASNAGLKTGDIIIQLGSIKIQSMQSYMEALSKFTPGDKTTVMFMRNGKEMSLPIELTKKQ